MGVIFMQKLPKTRSGKILRGTIRKICNQMNYGMPATIDDASTLDLIKEECVAWYKTIPAESVVKPEDVEQNIILETKADQE